MDIMKTLTLKWIICFLVHTKTFPDKYFVFWNLRRWILTLRGSSIASWKILKGKFEKCHVNITLHFKPYLFNLWHQQDNFIDIHLSRFYNHLFVDAKEFVTKKLVQDLVSGNTQKNMSLVQRVLNVMCVKRNIPA